MTQIGRRLPDGDSQIFAPGDYGRDSAGRWQVRPPRGHLGTLDDHMVTEHENGTITVSPSILSEPATEGHWLLERGIWREI